MEDKEYTIDLMELAGVMMENRKPIAKVTVCFIILAILYLLIASPVYESTALLQLKKQQGLGGSLLDIGGGGINLQQMNTTAEILKSRGVVIPLIEATEQANDEGKYPDYELYVKNRITTQPYKDTDLLQVRITANDPEKAQQINSMLITNFLKRMAEISADSQTATRGFLEERAKAAKEELDKAETALEQYKIDNKIISPSDSAKGFSDRLADAQKQLTANQIALEEAQTSLAVINSQLSGDASAIADNRNIQQYKTALANAEAERISYLDKYTEKHPKMIDVNDRIKNLQIKIDEEISKVASLQAPSDNATHQGLITRKFQSEAAIAVAQQKIAALQQIIEQNNKDLEALPSAEKGYIKAARDMQVANEIYIMLAKRLEEAKIAVVMQPSNVNIVDKPTLPDKPIKPRKLLILVAAALLGFLLSSGYLVAKELLNRTIKTEEDVRNYLELAVMGSIPDEASLNKALGGQQVNAKGFAERVKDFIWKK